MPENITSIYIYDLIIVDKIYTIDKIALLDYSINIDYSTTKWWILKFKLIFKLISMNQFANPTSCINIKNIKSLFLIVIL